MKQYRLVWREEWTTSIAWLNDEHRDLIDYYHAVVDALREDGKIEVFVERLHDLREWLGHHFKNESSRYSRSAAGKPINTDKTTSNSSAPSKTSPVILGKCMDIGSVRQWLDTFFIG